MGEKDRCSVCFFMVYHRRPEITRMAIYHMAKVLKKFSDAGHECSSFVVGDEDDQETYCNKLGLNHVRFKNDPLPDKFKYAWSCAIQDNKDYICWLGSNNVHSDDFWNKCLERISGKAIPTFGTKNFTIVDNDFSNQKTLTWTRRKYAFCSSGQFFYTTTIKKCVKLDQVFNRSANTVDKKDFDGSINKAIHSKYGADDVFISLDSHPLDCIDVKTNFDMHPFKDYDKGALPQRYTRDEVFGLFEELQMLEKREFRSP